MVAWISLAVSLMALFAAVASAMYTRRQALEAANMTRISEEDQLARLTPDFEVYLTPLNRGSDRRTEEQVMLLRVQLTGPVGLDELDGLEVVIRDDRPRTPLGHQVSQKEIDAQVWGPYTFTPGIDGASADGRSISMLAAGAGVVLHRGDSLRWQMSRTVPPRWYAAGQDVWRREHQSTDPVKLTLYCRSGPRSWVLPVEVSGSGWSKLIV